MKTLNNEMIITRGETFTMDKLLQNKDGSPYIISSKLEHPYWLITISSSDFEIAERYTKRYKLDLTEYPRFLYTNAMSFKEIFPNNAWFEEVTTPVIVDGRECIASVVVDGKVVGVEPTDYVFYLTKDGLTHYKYAKIINSTIKWYTYECRLIKAFSANDTLELSAQSYLYSISLIDDRSDDSICKTILLPTKLTIKNKL